MNKTMNTQKPRTMPSRRSFLKKGAVLTTAAWLPSFRVYANTSLSSCEKPANFPANLTLFQQAFRNWSEEIVVDAVWTCSPKTEQDIVTLVNWAHKQGYKVRPRGHMHNWSPLTIDGQINCTHKVILVDTTSHLTEVQIDTSQTPARVIAQTGVSMQDLMTKMETRNLGFVATPAPGDLTLGGVLAIDGHGTAIPADGQGMTSGQTYGSVSNTVLSLTAVVWDQTSQQYALKEFKRDNEECAAFLTHLGRAFITKATLQAGKNQRLHCQSYTHLSSDELFAKPGSAGRTIESFLKKSGRMEAIWFPFTKEPWLKVWTVEPTQPISSRLTLTPFNYPFTDNVPLAVSQLLANINNSAPTLTPQFGQAQLTAVKLGLATTLSNELWGWSKNTLLYIKPSTLRVTANGYAILTRRNNVQSVIHRFTQYYQSKVKEYQAQGLYPMNSAVEIRVTGLDQSSEVAMPNAVAPLLSAISPIPSKPDFNVAVWLDILSVPNAKGANRFYREVEAWVFNEFSGTDALARVEWSKGWAYSDNGAWNNDAIIKTQVPNSINFGQSSNKWRQAFDVFKKYDPNRIYSSPLIDRLGL